MVPEEDLSKDGNFDVAVSLFGAIAFSSCITYMLNHPHAKMRKTSWALLSKTLCTLMGVLISGSFGDVVLWLLNPQGDFQTLVVYVVLFICWTVLANAALHDGTILRETDLDKFKFKLEFWAPLLSITSGFSCKKVWSTGQAALVATARSEEALLASFLICVMLIPVMIGFNHVVRLCRGRYANLDGVEDKFEKVWLSKCSTCEENVSMMSLSFVFVQSCRLAITGFLPATSGSDPSGFVPTNRQCYELDSIATLFWVLAVVILSNRASMKKNLPEKQERFFIRVSLFAKNVLAWCWYFEGLWYTTPIFGQEVIGLTLQAISTTVLLMMVLRGIHHYMDRSDNNCHDPKLHHHHPNIEALMQPLALLIAWSWKSTFAAALKVIVAERVRARHIREGANRFSSIPDEVETWILTIILVSFILPAWRWFVLPVLHPLPPGNTQTQPLL